MKTIKRILRLFIVAVLSVVFALSVTACKTGSSKPGGTDNPGESGTPGGPGNPSGPGNPTTTPPETEGDTSGIDWTKYWDGTTSGGGADGFTFNQSINIGDVASTPVTGGTSQTLGAGISVNFDSKGGTAVATQSVESSYTAVKPVAPEKSGHMFVNWYEDSNLSTVYDFSTPIIETVTLYAKWEPLPANIKAVNSYNESLAVEFTGSATTTVEYKGKNDSSWTTVDAPLVRSIGGGLVRADVLGLAEGEYDVKIGSDTVSGIHVDAYDRSGYAHFNRKSSETAYNGIGAYTDDGTIKSNTLVIYVTEQNKNTVKTGYVNGAEVDLTPYLWQGKAGIGWILNNRGYENNSARENYGIQKLTFTYGAVAIRILGKVNAEDSSDASKSLVDGLTAYNSTGNGGSVGDNGRLARITNAKNLTIEGIGEDACMFGWGIHFVSNDNLHKYSGAGTSFEVRNITFENYPEDAIGMEGTQGTKVDQTTGSITSGDASADSDLISPVERCWVHNNTFLSGYCKSPAESDKKEGDGSCDFKRGQYYTLSYNHFKDCHKTNLLGSSDNSLTYNVTIHHNWYETVKSRQPIARRVNLHYYNNYITDATDYVTSFRGNCLVFSEANYYDGCKRVTQKNSGEGVAWNNIYYTCYDENNYTELNSRTETVTNSCKFTYRNIDYSKFYIQSDKFYYDTVNQVSDCLLDSATGARIRVLMSAGVNGSQTAANDTAINQYTPSNAVSVGSGLTIDLTKASKGNSIMSNVVLSGITGVDGSTGAKGKGQIITFTLTAPAEVKVNGTAKAEDHQPQIVDSFGKVWQDKFSGTVTVVLPAGTYFVTSGQKDKEATITSISFADTEASSQARVEAANNALAAIPNDITMNDETYVKAAQTAYSALRTDEQSQIDGELYQKLGKAVTALNQLRIEYVKARIDYIGTVDGNSYNKINAAQTAYDKLSAAQQAEVTNYSTLTAAWTAYAQFAAQNVIDRMLDLPEVENIQKINSLDILDTAQRWFDAVSNAFEGLTSDEDEGGQQAIVRAHDGGKTYAKLTNGLTALETRKAELQKAEAEKQALENFVAALEAVTDANSLGLAECNNIVGLYNQLSADKQAEYANNETYKAVEARAESLSKQAVESTFIGGKPSASVFTHTGSKQSAKNTKFVVHAYSEDQIASGLKFESGTELTLTITTKMTVTFYLFDSNSLAIDGTALTVTTVNGDNVATATLEAGTYKITRAKSEASLYYATLTPAN